jgi:hypothetical protein
MLQATDFLIQALPLLLHDHDCLVVPGLGGFVAHPVAARYDADKGEWVPPGRNVAFNPKLVVRDGLLEQEIRRATGCTNEAAAALIDREVESLRRAMEAGQTREIPSLGRLYIGENGLIAFAPESRIDERYAPPGLSRIPWVDRQTAPAQEATEADSSSTETTAVPEKERSIASDPEEKRTEWTPWLRAAAVLLPLMAISSVWWTRSDGAQFDLLPLSRSEASLYLPRIEGEDIQFPESGDAPSLSFISENAPLLTPSAEEAMMPIPQSSGLASGCRHHVIAGTFSSVARAATLARRFESLGYATTLLPGPSGGHRVSAGCFLKAQEAAAFKRGLQAHHGIEKAWILNL